MPRRLARALALCLAAFLGLADGALADDLTAARRLWMAGQRDAATTQVEQSLKRTPDSLELRFALGVMRLEMGQSEAAKAIFTALTQDFPDLAEPYNNLAVLYAAAGELELAQRALEQALRLQPDHAQAQENLGDVLLRLAVRAYERAQRAQLAPNASLNQKLNRTLALAHDLRPVQR